MISVGLDGRNVERFKAVLGEKHTLMNGIYC